MTKALRYSYPGCTDRYDIATCTDGKWHVTVHGKDRVLEYDCELRENEYGQYLKFGGGSILPLTDRNGKLFSRWSEATEEDLNHKPELNHEPLTLNPEPELDSEPELNHEPLTLNHEPELAPTLSPQIEDEVTECEAPEQPVVIARPKRQRRKKSKQEESNLLFNSEDTKPEAGNERNILKAVGGMAAMTLALVVIWETGLLIPLGILGLITSGILK